MNTVHINSVQIEIQKYQLLRNQSTLLDPTHPVDPYPLKRRPMKIISKTREDILEEALDFIAKEGLAQVTIRSLAQHSDVSVGTLYNYFGDKETLLEDIMNYYWKDAVGTLSEEARSFESIQELADALFIRLKHYYTRFHRDFIRNRDLRDSQEYMKRSMRTVFRILGERVTQSLDQLPFEEERFGKKADFATLLIDQVVNCLGRNEPDLGSLKIMIKHLEENK